MRELMVDLEGSDGGFDTTGPARYLADSPEDERLCISSRDVE